VESPESAKLRKKLIMQCVSELERRQETAVPWEAPSWRLVANAGTQQQTQGLNHLNRMIN
jgi:hypothetical protein